jgi:hypothetical protein
MANLCILGDIALQHLESTALGVREVLLKHLDRNMLCRTVLAAQHTFCLQGEIIFNSDNGYKTNILKHIGDCSTGGPEKAA